MSSKYFPSANVTHHILTVMSNPATRNLRERKEIWSSRLYPGGFPFHQLISGGLSEQSASCMTPKQAYTRMINKWQWKQAGKAKKEAREKFSDSEDDGPGPTGKSSYLICYHLSFSWSPSLCPVGRRPVGARRGGARARGRGWVGLGGRC
jgi:hypothetical protein